MNDYILPKLWQTGLKTTKSIYLGGPTQGTNLNPIENVWAELKKHVQARGLTNRTLLH